MTPHQLVNAVCDLLDTDEMPDELAARLGEALGRRAGRRLEAGAKRFAAAMTEAGAAFQRAMVEKPEPAGDLMAALRASIEAARAGRPDGVPTTGAEPAEASDA